MNLEDVVIPKDYDIKSDKGEYMNSVQLKYFYNLLESEKKEILECMSPKIKDLSISESLEGDEGDIANLEIARNTSIRITDRQLKLVKKIDEAIVRIQNGEYGYCSATGEPIGILRLLARPVTSLCVAEQNKRENDEKIHESYDKNAKILAEERPYEDDE